MVDEGLVAVVEVFLNCVEKRVREVAVFGEVVAF